MTRSLGRLPLRSKIPAHGNMTSPSAMRRMHCLVGWFFLCMFSLLALQFSIGGETALERVKKAGALTVCLDPDNLPYSNSTNTPPGFDIEISQQLAKALGVEIKFFWVDTI